MTSITLLKRPLSSSKSDFSLARPKKKFCSAGRKIVPIGAAPSTDTIDDLAVGIREHAHLRIQLFFIAALALYGKAERTNKSPSRVVVVVKRASMQVGQGTRENHAAHANASANLSDDLKEIYLAQIEKEGLTPKKTRLLSIAKKLPLDDLSLIKENHEDKAFVKKIIDHYWPHDSLLKGTNLEYILNSTDRLPAALNLVCDRHLEKEIRPKIAELFRKVMRGEVDPKTATSEYTKEIQNHFTEEIKDLEKKLVSLSTDDKLLNQLFYNKEELAGSIEINYKALSKAFEGGEGDLQPIIDVEKTFDLFL